jgi:hypothetical protein
VLRDDVAIVLGAGSSLTFGFPLGSALRNDIAKILAIEFDSFGSNLKAGSQVFLDALKNHARDQGQTSVRDYVHAARDIAEALPVCLSIDDVIERHSRKVEYNICAKSAIAEAIQKYESKSGIAFRSGSPPDISRFDGKWITSLLQGITRGCGVGELSEAFSRLKVINFNYDRCFEQFAFLWLKRAYRLSDSEATETLANACIIHPYGSLGELRVGQRTIPFGQEPNASLLAEIFPKIFTYSESRDEKGTAKSVQQIVDNCRSIVFFGFAFHPQNIRLMKSDTRREMHTRHVYSTNVGIPEPRWEVIGARMSECLNVDAPNLFLHRSTDSCENLLHEFGDSWLEF